MPSQQPSNATDKLELREDATAAAIIADDSAAGMPLGGGGAADLTGLGGGTAPNSPIDVPIGAADGANAAIERDARDAASRSAPEPHPLSQ